MEIDAMKRVFLESAVRVVARDGLEKATTKNIAKEAHLNEAYIYRCFPGKDELLSEALHQEDVNFVRLLLELLDANHALGLNFKERAYVLWKRSWDFILELSDDFLFYVRYYYSTCRGKAYEEHLECYKPVVERCRPYFKEGVNMDILVHQIFSTMLFFGCRVITGELTHDEETACKTFEQIYYFVEPNVRPEILEEVTL